MSIRKRLTSTMMMVLLAIPCELLHSGDDYDPTSLVFPSFLHTMGVRKATKTHLRIYSRNKVKVRDPQGLTVVRMDSWDDPESKNDDDEVTGYGVNSGANMIVYNKSMTSLDFYGPGQRGAGKLNKPTAVVADRFGNVYVADTGNHRIVKMFNPKKKLEFVEGIGGFGSRPGLFNAPGGLAMDSNGMVYISDTGNHRIQELRPDNQIHLWFGEQGKETGQLWRPQGIAVTNGQEKWTFYKDSFIVVIDLDGQRLQKFTLDGGFIAKADLAGSGVNNARLNYIALDYYSNIWVTDSNNHCIHKFDRGLNYLCSFGRKGDDDKEFIEPRGISIYKRFGQVFIAEKESAQYYWVGVDIKDLQIKYDEKLNALTLAFFLVEPTFFSLTVTTPEGNKVESFKRARYFSGKHLLRLSPNLKQWKASNQNASFVSGDYRFELKLEATYSSLNYFSKKMKRTLTIK